MSLWPVQSLRVDFVGAAVVEVGFVVRRYDSVVILWNGDDFSFRFEMVFHVQRREIHRPALLRLIADCCLGVAAIGSTQTGKLAAVRSALGGLVWFSLAFGTHDQPVPLQDS